MPDWINVLQDNYPVRITKILSHSANWLFSSATNYIFPNPHFNPLNDKKTTVYCIHGTADYPGSLRPLANLLIETELSDSIEQVILLNFPERFTGKSIEFFAEHLLNDIKQRDIKNVILIGHSRGGLINPYLAENLELNDLTIEAIFSYGTPYSGSEHASNPLSFFSTSVKEMKVNSHFLEKLRQQIVASTTPYFFIAAPKDKIVTTQSAIITEYCQEHSSRALILQQPEGHLSMLSSPEAINYIKQSLAELPQSMASNSLAV